MSIVSSTSSEKDVENIHAKAYTEENSLGTHAIQAEYG